MPILDSTRHPHATRPLIPTQEAEGAEAANPVVQEKRKAMYDRDPVIRRDQSPHLVWLHKYGENGDEEQLEVDLRSLYIKEYVSPELIVKQLYSAKDEPEKQLDLFETFGNQFQLDELDKPPSYYTHADGWSNRLILGDSLHAMASLANREAFEGKVQMIYFDPPYGIKYNSNWQIKINDRTVKDGDDDHLSKEPEQVKAYRDTWEMGVHSYLSYLRDRFLVAKQLLHESGSIFVQISDENVHLVRSLMDEAFGSENFVSLISFKTTSSLGGALLSKSCDYIIWYGKNIDLIKYRNLLKPRALDDDIGNRYTRVQLGDGTRRVMTTDERENSNLLPKNSRIYRHDNLTSQSGNENAKFSIEFNGDLFTPGKRYWTTTKEGIERLKRANRLAAPTKNSLTYIRFFDDFEYSSLTNVWTDTQTGAFTDDKVYVVQTNKKVIERCMLMATDPGDLVLDPSCGSGTTAYVAEQWGRRWITIDTSRIALNIAKTRLMTATFPYYELRDAWVRDAVTGAMRRKTEDELRAAPPDVRHGFFYKEVPHITLKSLANDEEPEVEKLYDQIEPKYIAKDRMRVTGTFTVESLQSLNPLPPEAFTGAEDTETEANDAAAFTARVRLNLTTNGIRNGQKGEHVVFKRVEPYHGAYLHAIGFYDTPAGERTAYFHIGDRFGTVSKDAARKALIEARQRMDCHWLVLLGMQHEDMVQSQTVQTHQHGELRIDKVRMGEDLLQDGLSKKEKKAAVFVTLGEPDLDLRRRDDGTVEIELLGYDIYDPIGNMVRSRSPQDLAYWCLDDDYDGTGFVVRQIFFCGSSDQDEFDKIERGLHTVADRLKKTLRIEIDEEALERLYGYVSAPIRVKGPGHKVAVRVVSQFGEETTKVVGVV